MLSATYTMTDIKNELENYDVYGYENQSEFETNLEFALDIAIRDRIYPIIDETLYDVLADEDKTGLSTQQLYVYWAEIYYAVAEFCLFHARRDKYKRRSARETRTQGDVTYSNIGMTGKEMMAYDYISKGDKSLAEGGYHDVQVRLTRRTSIYGS